MIWFWNRAEVICTYDMKKQSDVREILSQNKIAYSVRVIDRRSSSFFSAGRRANTGSFGEKAEIAKEYIIYVNRRDLDRAKFLLRQ
ncbi:MAG: hypothetical protein Q4E24_14335 [bacterium]|nr:hypothetical protein [bacterium]